ncbi:MAG: nicotinate (nicotinamide) nucleotide adenylyltransferase [Clostridia bacterium]|jgi:nicotinate-nucleotide adenylyltransferase|nr:nicotinate (nicotinamide) nucleotide adenylyltransferase [Clostridia bacterium]
MINKQILIFGGCFNPPQNSHLSLAEQLINEYEEIEKIIFVPVNSKYQKIDLIENEHRYNMLKLICDKNEKFDVSRIEIDSDRPLYTIETLKAFQKLYPENEISFIIGSDNLKELCTWNNSNELVKDFKIYVLERSYDDIKNIINSNDFLKNNSSAFIKAKNTIVSNLSSTFIRDKIRNGKSVRYLTPDEVISYINNNNLYK